MIFISPSNINPKIQNNILSVGVSLGVSAKIYRRVYKKIIEKKLL